MLGVCRGYWGRRSEYIILDNTGSKITLSGERLKQDQDHQSYEIVNK